MKTLTLAEIEHIEDTASLGKMNLTEFQQLLATAKRGLEMEKVAQDLYDALIGCVQRLRVVCAEQVGDPYPDFESAPPSALNNIRNVSEALTSYNTLTKKTDE